MITCWLTQQWRVIRGDSGLSGFVARHLASCPSCKALAIEEDRLIQRMQKAAGGERVSPPPFLHGKIMASLDREEKTPFIVNRRPVWESALVWTPAAILCVAVLLWMRQPPQQETFASKSPANDTAVQQAIMASTKYANGQLFLKLGEKVENPLRREMAYVVMDAKTAVSGIASRFLPENALAANIK